MEKNKDRPLKFKRYPEYKDSGVEWLGMRDGANKITKAIC